ncbi:type I toxin-antitoxin system Fst family toxin [Staphylococcus epidermidis]
MVALFTHWLRNRNDSHT